MAVLNLMELKAKINQSFDGFSKGSVSLNDGLTLTNDWAPKSVVLEAMNWWDNVKHGELNRRNDQIASGMGPAWSPTRWSNTRGPVTKLYSTGREIVNFEYFVSREGEKHFNYHVPLFPLNLANAAPPAAIPSSLHGWKLTGGAWVHKRAPTVNAWSRVAQKDQRGF